MTECTLSSEYILDWVLVILFTPYSIKPRVNRCEKGVNESSVISTISYVESFWNESIWSFVVYFDHALGVGLWTHKQAHKGVGFAVSVSNVLYSENRMVPTVELTKDTSARLVTVLIRRILNPFCCNALAYESICWIISLNDDRTEPIKNLKWDAVFPFSNRSVLSMAFICDWNDLLVSMERTCGLSDVRNCFGGALAVSYTHLTLPTKA